MKQKFVIIATFLYLASAIATEAFSQWVQTGPYGGDITALTFLGSDLFAGTMNAGIFRSSDNGTSWTAVRNGLTNTDVSALAVLGTNLFAGVHGIAFRSTNDGMSWTEVDSGLPDVQFFAVIGTNIFAAEPKGVFRSTNNGINWIEADSGIDFMYNDASILSFAALGKNLFAGTSDGLYLSADNGISWSEVDDLSTYNMDNEFGALAVSGKNLFALTFDGVLGSNDNGATWSLLLNLYGNFYGTTLIASGTNILAANDGFYGGGIYRSTNNGATWAPIHNGLPTTTIRAFAVSGKNIFAGTAGTGIYRSTDNGASWNAVNSGLTNVIVTGIVASGANIFSGTSVGISKSTDNGASWINTNDSLFPVRALGISGTNLFVSAAGGVFISKDNGQSWTMLSRIDGISLAASGASIFVGTSREGVYFSTDNGVNWFADTSGLRSYQNSIQVLSVLGANLFVGTSDMGILRSDLTGYWPRWSQANNGLPSSNWDIRALANSGASLFAGTNGGGVYFSTDTGRTWTAVNDGLTNYHVSSLAIVGTSIFAGTGDGVFFSTNNGARWTAFNKGLSSTEVNALAASSTDLFAGTGGNGIYRRPLVEMINNVESASDTQAVLFNGMGTMNVTLSGDSARNRIHRIDFVNNSSVTLVITDVALTSSNDHFSISQLLPDVPDTLKPGEMFSMIVSFLGDTSGTVYQDTIVLMIDHAVTSSYIYLNGKSFATGQSGVSIKSESVSNNIRISTNPFSNFTTIHYRSSISGHVQVYMMNLLGSEVAHIFSGELDAGEHTFPWNASSMPAGMYIAIVKTGREVGEIPVMLRR
ncbi:MAG: regulator [Bacteroidota bacterium]|nr:regulator [Bacteroidota bacterium]MDP4229733.1 regulator [Bacteroidota bacterium]MDP4236378.1 regulator [Bacteroidota bacterium]